MLQKQQEEREPSPLSYNHFSFVSEDSVCLSACRVFEGRGRGLNTLVSAYVHLNRKEGDPNSFSVRANEMVSTADMVEAGKLMQEKQHTTFVP